ncbi:SDR family NAD(P)-dependent oxidoreductase [Sphingopyxis sp.]|uniref:SDR family NAD(P)-dependent oxidoreductase n=1 Tax=Sphingopyxis sp. TaxID=1908224 RepID=UPI00260E973C|nr:SDR family NAD(P)-dependent oxidoreductase [Sphingopyxis sp.]MCW0199432.1 SDR family NAD(P)-dependent oxidoreductase [Sphingopyxis sp.]
MTGSPSFASAGLEGSVVVIVGASRGLGRQYAADLARAGARLVLTGRGEDVATAAETIRREGGIAIAIRCDIRDPAPFVEAALAEYGSIDGLVINAGVVRDRSFAKMTAEEWSEVIDVHLGGSFACAKAVWEPMTTQGRGSIVFTTSGAGMHGAFGQANYAAAKSGIIGLMKTLAIEGERLGIRANAIAPMALTEMTDGVFSDRMKHCLRPEQISPFLMALLDPGSTRTGEIVECGGGWGAQMRWQRSAGDRMTAAPFGSEFDLPETTADSLGAALGDPRTMYRMA